MDLISLSGPILVHKFINISYEHRLHNSVWVAERVFLFIRNFKIVNFYLSGK